MQESTVSNPYALPSNRPFNATTILVTWPRAVQSTKQIMAAAVKQVTQSQPVVLAESSVLAETTYTYQFYSSVFFGTGAVKAQFRAAILCQLSNTNEGLVMPDVKVVGVQCLGADPNK